MNERFEVVRTVRREMKKKSQALFCRVFFLTSEDTLEELALKFQKDGWFEELENWFSEQRRRSYTYQSLVPVEPGSLVTVTCRRKGNFQGMGLGVVTRLCQKSELNSEVLNLDSGMVVGSSDYLLRLHDGVEEREAMLREKELLQERVRQELEKARLSALLAGNPDLARDVETFKERYPEVRFLEGNSPFSAD